MYPSALNAFQAFSGALEGVIPWMYLDNEGLVTTGTGNLIDPVNAALSLPWQHSDGSASRVANVSGKYATQDEISEAWSRVKARQDMKDIGGGSSQFAALSDLRLSQDDINRLFQEKLTSNVTTLKRYFPSLDSWPADAQLAALGMAWALGAAFATLYPKFTDAANSGNWRTAAVESHISNGTAARNAEQALMLANAAAVTENNLDPSVLHFPHPVSVGEAVALGAGATAAIGIGAGAIWTAGAGLFLLGYGTTKLLQKTAKKPTRSVRRKEARR
jgi:GH24 family phage-related lysozyme (muramidase)